MSAVVKSRRHTGKSVKPAAKIVVPETTRKLNPAKTVSRRAGSGKAAPKEAVKKPVDDETQMWVDHRDSPSVESRNRIIEFYRPWIERIAELFWMRISSRYSFDPRDFENEAILAMPQVISVFDPQRGVRFTTFAALRLNGAMLDYLRSLDFVPRLERLKQRRDPEHKVVDMRSQSQSEFSERHFENAPAQEGEDLDNVDFWSTIVRGMSKTESLIVQMHFRQGLTMKVVGRELSLSESRVSQVISAILVRLKGRASVQQLQLSDRT